MFSSKFIWFAMLGIDCVMLFKLDYVEQIDQVVIYTDE